MTKSLLALALTLCAVSFEKAGAQCTPRALPFTENFSVTPFAACTPTVGGWISTTAASGAGWWLPTTNYAGGTIPEVEAYGDQANGGISETIRLISPPLNTIGVAGINLSFKHNLYLTNSGASGSNVITLNVEYSQDSINWTWAYSDYFNTTPSLQSVVLETRSINITGLAGNTTYVRFNISGVLFKVWGWEIDNINITVNSSTMIPERILTDRMIYLDKEQKKLEVNVGEGKTCTVLLCDLIGNVVLKSEIVGHAAIDVEAFRKGVYVVQLLADKDGITRKIVLE